MTEPSAEGETSGRGLYIVAAWVGAIGFFTAPATVLMAGGKPLLAAILGYAAIGLFTGGIAARFEVIVSRQPLVQLLANLGLALAFTSIFFLVFLLLYHL